MAEPNPILRLLPRNPAPMPDARAFAVQVTTATATIKIEADDESAVARLLAMFAAPAPTPTQTLLVAAPAPAKPQAQVSITVPDFIPRKLPVDVTINGETRKVAACVCRALAEIAQGTGRVRMRGDAYAKLRAQVPEIVLRRDHEHKVIGKRIPYLCAQPVAAIK